MSILHQPHCLQRSHTKFTSVALAIYESVHDGDDDASLCNEAPFYKQNEGTYVVLEVLALGNRHKLRFIRSGRRSDIYIPFLIPNWGVQKTIC